MRHGQLRPVWTSLRAFVCTAAVGLAACQTAPDAAETADKSPSPLKEETLTDRMDRLERDMAALRIDYSILRPQIEQAIGTNAGLKDRLARLEENLGTVTGSVTQAEANEDEGNAAEASGQAQLTQSANVPSYGLHLGSYRNRQTLNQDWTQLKSSYPDILGGLDLQIRNFDAGKDGTYQRLIAGPLANKATADKLCAEIKQKGTWCQSIRL